MQHREQWKRLTVTVLYYYAWFDLRKWKNVILWSSAVLKQVTYKFIALVCDFFFKMNAFIF